MKHDESTVDGGRVKVLAMTWKKMPDLQPSFDQFASRLEARAEGG